MWIGIVSMSIRIRIWISIKMPSRIWVRIRIDIKTVPIHNAVFYAQHHANHENPSERSKISHLGTFNIVSLISLLCCIFFLRVFVFPLLYLNAHFPIPSVRGRGGVFQYLYSYSVYVFMLRPCPHLPTFILLRQYGLPL